MKEETGLKVHPSLRRTHIFCLIVLGLAFWARQSGIAGNHDRELVSGCLGMVAFVLLVSHFVRLFTYYTITQDYVQMTTGIVARDVRRAPITRVTDFSISQSIGQRLLMLGNVGISTAGSTGEEFHFIDLTSTNLERVIGELTRFTTGRTQPTDTE